MQCAATSSALRSPRAPTRRTLSNTAGGRKKVGWVREGRKEPLGALWGSFRPSRNSIQFDFYTTRTTSTENPQRGITTSPATIQLLRNAGSHTARREPRRKRQHLVL